MVPVTNRPGYELQRIILALNGHPPFEQQVLGPEDEQIQKRRFRETPPLLRRLVDAWLLLGSNLSEFSRQHRDLWQDVDRYWKRAVNSLLLVNVPGGGAALGMNSPPEREPYDEALRLFIELLLNPECTKLAGPCERCGNYYVIRRSRKNKVYCSRSCGSRATATTATANARQKAHAEKLRRAQSSARQWDEQYQKGRTKADWKEWVSNHEPDITPKFLTRAVNHKELTPPTKARRSSP